MSPQQPHLDDYTAAMEQRALRESYERAGYDAHRLGVPRNGNPYAPCDHGDAGDHLRQERLCEYWWCGWDQAARTRKRGRVKGSR